MTTEKEKHTTHSTDEEPLNVDWNDIKGKIRSRYDTITDDDFAHVEGNETEIINRLQFKTGKTKKEVRDWVRSLSKVM